MISPSSPAYSRVNAFVQHPLTSSFTPRRDLVHTSRWTCKSRAKRLNNLRPAISNTTCTEEPLNKSDAATDTAAKQPSKSTLTEDVFAIDAGRDLFFPGMDEAMAIRILDVPLGEHENKDDRFIAAERLKFFVSEHSTNALMRFIRRFNASEQQDYMLEDMVARRKAVETLGRMKGSFLKQQVIQLLLDCLQDNDPYMVDTAVWSLGEVGVASDHQVLQRIVSVLSKPDVDRRVVVQTLVRANYTASLPQIQPFIDSDDIRLSTAARAAVATFTKDDSLMEEVVSLLRSDELNIRRSAIEDITLAKYKPALSAVAVCPNSLILRTRTARELLEEQKDELGGNGERPLDDKTAILLDKLIWDHPKDLDLLGLKKETKKARNVDRNIKQLYKNDALSSYLACRTLAEDHRDDESAQAGAKTLQSYNDLDYFDYFGAYHAYKTLGWLRYQPAYDLLLDNAKTLPPRFFNHKAGAITALAELGNKDALDAIHDVALNSSIWELTYACLIAAERLGDGGKLRKALLHSDNVWIIKSRCLNPMTFNNLQSDF